MNHQLRSPVTTLLGIKGHSEFAKIKRLRPKIFHKNSYIYCKMST